MTRLRSYTNLHEASPEVARPRSEEEVAELLVRAGRTGRRAVFRAAGGSLHDQALSDDLVLDLDALPAEIEARGTQLLGTAMATCGEALEAALHAGRLPPVLPTASRLTLGGSLASNALSRFSASYGRMSTTVSSFELLTPDGTRRSVRRPTSAPDALNDALFRAVPGAYGRLGLVTSLVLETADLAALTPALPGRPRAETTLAFRPAMEALAEALILDHLRRHPIEPGEQDLRRALAAPLPTASWVLSGLDGGGFLLRSRLVPGDTPRDPFFLHEPQGLAHQAGQLASFSSAWNTLGFSVARRGMRRREGAYIDDLPGFTFMMEGNWFARDRIARLGLHPWMVQQSFCLPILRGGSPAGPTVTFVESLRRELRDRRLAADVVDMLVVPREEGPLSSSPDGECVVVTFATQGLRRAGAAPVIAAARALARRAAELGGRVHLAKNVFVEPDVLQQMYGPGVRALESLAARVDPQGVLCSPFLRAL